MATPLQNAIIEKRRILRQEYGGLMTLENLKRELGYKSRNAAQGWAREENVPRVRFGKKFRYDTDAVAKILVQRREPA